MLLRGAGQDDLSKLANLGVAFCLPKGYRIRRIMDHEQVKLDMLQLVIGQKKKKERKGGGGMALKEKNIGHK